LRPQKTSLFARFLVAMSFEAVAKDGKLETRI